jgi:hypothetical protein
VPVAADGTHGDLRESRRRGREGEVNELLATGTPWPISAGAAFKAHPGAPAGAVTPVNPRIPLAGEAYGFRGRVSGGPASENDLWCLNSKPRQ